MKLASAALSFCHRRFHNSTDFCTHSTLCICKISMAMTYTRICVTFWLLLSNAQGLRSNCKFQNIQSSIYGQACEKQEYINISVTERLHCSLACINNRECKAIVLDLNHSVCMLLPEPCMLLTPYPDHVYQSFQHPCTKWVPNSHSAPGYWIYEGIGKKSYIARTFINDDLVVGKMTKQFFAIDPNGTTVIKGGNSEKLVVDELCDVTWVSYDATSGKALPGAAFIGGFLAATYTPLYVTRLPVTTSAEVKKAVGYYNPLNRMAWGQLDGIRKGTMFEIMEVQPPSAIP